VAISDNYLTPPYFSGPAQKKIIHFGGSPYIRGRASRFNSLLFRTFVIIMLARPFSQTANGQERKRIYRAMRM